MTRRADVVVLGGDLEGMVAAVTLARDGRRVILCDEREWLGGAARRETLAGSAEFTAPGPLEDAVCVRRELLAPLELDQHGLEWNETVAPLLCAGDERSLLLSREPAQLDATSDDRGAYAEWRGFLDRVGEFVRGVLDATPPAAENPSRAELWRLAKTGLKLRRLGDKDMLELLRIAPMPGRDWMSERFADPLLQAGLVGPALLGSLLGPRAAGTSALLLLRECSTRPEPRGGAAALVDALERACAAAGVELRLGQPLRSIRVGRSGVESVSCGEEELATQTVLSTLGPRQTLLDLITPIWLPENMERMARAWRSAGSTAILRLGLSAPPAFAGYAAGEIERACTARSLVELERSADALKYGELPAEPWLFIRVPSLSDPSLAPAGGALLTAAIHGVPHRLRRGWDAAARTKLEERAMAALERVLPGIGTRVVAKDLVTPLDLEQRYRLTGGHLYGGELALDQLWIQRPSMSFSRYRTAIPGLYLGGTSSHPGGPFLGGAGALSARALCG